MQYTRKYYIYIINIHLYTYFFFFFFRRYFWRLISSLSHVIVSCLSCILLEAGNYLINMDHLEKKISIFEIYIYFFYWALGWGYCDFWIFFFFFSIFFFYIFRRAKSENDGFLCWNSLIICMWNSVVSRCFASYVMLNRSTSERQIIITI